MSEKAYKFQNNKFGKKTVKLLYVKKTDHSIRELETTHFVTIATDDEFTKGNNKNLIETNSHSNAIFILAKNCGIKSPEDFGILFCKHMLRQYDSILNVSIYLEEVSWDRLKYDDCEKTHNHAFINNRTCKRFALVEMKKNDFHPKVTSGVKNFLLLKTAKSSFFGFVCDEYCNLEDIYDRVLSTSIDCSWTYSHKFEINFDTVFKKVQDLILFGWSGKLKHGVQSTSTQATSYTIEKIVLDNMKEVNSIEMTLQNLYYNAFDFNKIESINVNDGEETVFVPIKEPAGLVHSELERK